MTKVKEATIRREARVIKERDPVVMNGDKVIYTTSRPSTSESRPREPSLSDQVLPFAVIAIAIVVVLIVIVLVSAL